LAVSATTGGKLWIEEGVSMELESIYNMVRLVGENLVLMKRAASSNVVAIEWFRREGNAFSTSIGIRGSQDVIAETGLLRVETSVVKLCMSTKDRISRFVRCGIHQVISRKNGCGE